MKLGFLFLFLPLICACQKSEDQPRGPEVPSEPGGPPVTSYHQVVYTHMLPSGNRVFSGKGSGSEQSLDISLTGKPVWLAATSSTDFSYWIVALENGTVEAFMLRPDQQAFIFGGRLGNLLPGMPPVLALNSSGAPVLVKESGADAAPNSPSLVLGTDTIAYLTKTGDLIIRSGADTQRLSINALPDAWIVSNDLGELAILSQPTTDYQHGVLGDAVEARAITIVSTQPDASILHRIDMPGEVVIEGISPIWADVDEDGAAELLVTQSNNPEGAGAKLVVYKKDGSKVAEGPLSPGGWRHQLAVFRPAPGDPVLIVDCQKPHVQRIINFYRLAGNQLEVVGSKPGYSTHQLGLRNLDMALAGDFDGDGVQEILVPSTDYLEVRAIVLEQGQAVDKDFRPAGGKISTNFSAAMLDGKLIWGVGTENGKLRVWWN